MRRRLLALEWVSQVPSFTFVRGVTEIEKRVDFARPIPQNVVPELVEKLRGLIEISSYFPQTTIVLAIKLIDMLAKEREEDRELLEQIVDAFAANYHEYLQSVGDKQALSRIPRYFIGDVKQGMNLTLLELLIKKKSIPLLSVLLSAMPIPTTTPPSLITELIKIDPIFMTSKVAMNYTPQQVVLAISEILASIEREANQADKQSSDMKIETRSRDDATIDMESGNTGLNAHETLVALIQSVPALRYRIDNLDFLVHTIAKHQLQRNSIEGVEPVDYLSLLPTVVNLDNLSLTALEPPTQTLSSSTSSGENVAEGGQDAETEIKTNFAPGASYALLCRHFAQSEKYSNLQEVMSAKGYNMNHASDTELISLLNTLFERNARVFAFQIVMNLPEARVMSIQSQTLDKWTSSTKFSNNTELQSFMSDMYRVVDKFGLKIVPPSLENTSIKDTQAKSTDTRAEKAEISEKTETSQNIPSPSLTKDEIYVSKMKEILKKDFIPKFSLPGVKKYMAGEKIEREAEPSQIEIEESEKQTMLLSLVSRMVKADSVAEWSDSDRKTYLESAKTFDQLYPGEMPLGVWSTYLLALYKEVELSNWDNRLMSELDDAARSFENYFLAKRPKLLDRDVSALSFALTTLGQYLWLNGRHSSAMSIANIMSFYKLRTTLDFEQLVRNQATPQASISGLSPLSWLRSVAKDSNIDISFFNSLPGFLASSIKFDLEESFQYANQKRLAAQEALHLTESLSKDSKNSSKSGKTRRNLEEFHGKFVSNPQLEANLARAAEVWAAMVPVWNRARGLGWVPTSDFASMLLRLAQMQRAPASFIIETLKYCHSHQVTLVSRDIPLAHILRALMEASNYSIGNYLLSSQGLNMLASLPSHISTSKPLTSFIMRCLAQGAHGDVKNADLAYRLFTTSYSATLRNDYTAVANYYLVEAYFQVCGSKKAFSNAEKLLRALLPLHASSPQSQAQLYALTIELAGQCGDPSSAIRLYNEAAKSCNSDFAPQLVHTILRAVTACNILPVETQKLRKTLDQPSLTTEDQLKQTNSFLASIPPSDLTRRSRNAYISL